MIVHLTVQVPEGESRAFEFRRDAIHVGAGSKNDLIVASSEQRVRMMTLHVAQSGLRVAPEPGVAVTMHMPADSVRRPVEPDLIVPVGTTLWVGEDVTVRIDGVFREDGLTVTPLQPFSPTSPEVAFEEAEAATKAAIVRLAYRVAALDDPLAFISEVHSAFAAVAPDANLALQLVLPAGADMPWSGISVFGVGDARLPLETVQFGRGVLLETLSDGRLAQLGQGDLQLLLVPITSGTRLRAVIAVHAGLDAESLLVRLRMLLSAVRPWVLGLTARYRAARETTALQEENRYFKERQRRHYLFKDLVSESPAMRKLHQDLGSLVTRDAAVLLTGEAGTGKELLARALHHLGGRSPGLLVSQQCGDGNEDTLDLELFGFAVRGGERSTRSQRGIFELAHGGTVFLDEIHLLAPRLQAKLFRVLAESEVFRIGESLARPVDVRVVCATHLDLMDLADEGRFRRDLAIALTRHTLHVPPLRERREDLVPLIELFVRKWARRYRKQIESVAPETVAWLQSLQWPGNVRELLTVIERAVLQAKPDQLVLRREDFVLG